MSLSREDVQHVAALARLGMSDSEIDEMQVQLSSILEHIDELGKLDTDTIPPTAQVVELTNVYRDDEVVESLPPEAVMNLAPDSRKGFFAVAAVMGGDEGGSA